ncbi:hypothetical protein JCM8202v2_002533 [Rhodotorula sphaerocarpa]
MWLWQGSSDSVTCFYCNSRLSLLPPASAAGSRSAKSYGKQRQLDGRLALGTKDDFWCSECGQITRIGDDGEILSDEAAHHDPALNEDSFALRATLPRDRIPTSFPTPATTPFCRQCLSNQALQLHLLASYPTEDNPAPQADPRRDGDHANGATAANYPPLVEYRRTLDLRYPLVCADCAPAIESTIRERDYRVKAQALGWRLRESERKRALQEQRSEEVRRREGRKWIVARMVWRIRGLAWMATQAVVVAHLLPDTITANSSTLLTNLSLPRSTILDLALLALAITSAFWSFWDPTWNTAETERIRGRDPVIKHRPVYLAAQMTAYLARIVYVAVRLIKKSNPLDAVVAACFTPSVRPKHPIRLVARSRGSTTPLAAASHADPLEPLANLSLSHNGSLLVPSPPSTPTTAADRRAASGFSAHERKGSPLAFGVDTGSRPASPAGRTTPFAPQAGSSSTAADSQEMDWCPTPPPQNAPSAISGTESPSRISTTNHITFARQRFVPPDTRQPTGLEGMFERVVAVRDGALAAQEADSGKEVEMRPIRSPNSSKGWLAWWK